MSKKEQLTYYFTDELNDEFSNEELNKKVKDKIIDEKYKYIHKSFFWKLTNFIFYRLIAYPVACTYLCFKFRHKVIGKEKLKNYKSGYFMFGNHTQELGDGFIPNVINYPRNTYIIVNSRNLAIPFLGKIFPYLGAIPLPSDLKSTKNFISAIDNLSNKNNCIMIYPEAHIWPYYTKIRPFKSTSFRYPVKLNKPCFALTNTYQQRKNGKVKITTYIDGPFYPNKDLDLKAQEEDLRNQVYDTMTERSKNSNFEFIKYVRRKDE